MKNKSAKIVVFVASTIVGLLIALNFNFEGKRTSQLSAKEYQDAIEERSRLYNEISNLHDINNDAVNKINEYTYSDEKQEKIFESMKNQLGDYGRLTGLNEVKGPGIVIRINDGIVNYSDLPTQYEVTSKIFHDKDMLQLLNEIRYAGAEAIAMNDYRIRPSSAIMCHWAFLIFEDETQLSAPFYLYAIGDPEMLRGKLLEDGSHLRQLMTRGLDITIENSDEIIMPAAKSFKFEYASEYVKKDE